MVFLHLITLYIYHFFPIINILLQKNTPLNRFFDIIPVKIFWISWCKYDFKTISAWWDCVSDTFTHTFKHSRFYVGSGRSCTGNHFTRFLIHPEVHATNRLIIYNESGNMVGLAVLCLYAAVVRGK